MLGTTGSAPPETTVADDDQIYFAGHNMIETANVPSNGGGNNGFYDNKCGVIYVNAHVDDGSIVIHEYFHTYDGQGDPAFGWNVDEGLTDFFARDASKRFSLKYKGNAPYEDGYQAVKKLVDKIGIATVAKMKFERPIQWMTQLKSLLDRLEVIITNVIHVRQNAVGAKPLLRSKWDPPSLPITVDECVDAIADTGVKNHFWHLHRDVAIPKPVKI
jgi:hypothetical protein